MEYGKGNEKNCTEETPTEVGAMDTRNGFLEEETSSYKP